MIEIIAFLALALTIVVIAIRTAPPPWLRDGLSRNWPTAEGTIEGGDVYAVGAAGRKSFRTKLKYAYRVNDQVWAGTDTQDFDDEETASDYVKSRRGVAAQLKYNPRKPQRSFLL